MRHAASFVVLLALAACSSEAQQEPAPTPTASATPVPATGSAAPAPQQSPDASAVSDTSAAAKAPTEAQVRELQRELEQSPLVGAKLARPEDLPPELAEVQKTLKTARRDLAACLDKDPATSINIEIHVGADGKATIAIKQKVSAALKSCVARVIGSLTFQPAKVDTFLVVQKA